MPTLTLSIPPELKSEMDEHKIINWSEVAREAIRHRIEQFKIVQSIASRSKLTEKDALILGRKIRHGMHLRLMKENPEYYRAVKNSKTNAKRHKP